MEFVLSLDPFLGDRHMQSRKSNKNSLAQEVRQMSDISDRRIRVRPPSTLTLPHGRWFAVRHVRGHLTPKMNCNLFYHKLDAEYFFI